MEKTTSLEKSNITAENLTLNNRKYIKIEGIVEVVSSSDNSIILKLKDTTLSISGDNINITKLDVTSGNMEAEGNFNLIKYGKQGNIFKRLFK